MGTQTPRGTLERKRALSEKESDKVISSADEQEKRKQINCNFVQLCVAITLTGQQFSICRFCASWVGVKQVTLLQWVGNYPEGWKSKNGKLN